ncbi:hypothetical protein IVB27_32950 [Bradyrhizobium sp. 197]|uniref:hypothetical protein n=1 Tax=Bradyrhizobium sp. 197 TaxID=2782663 RepID=UPI001FF91871|nr:hypothetical protein [Bradyrhizobium sp. 197]MCK1479424.1 hypothetical protein [Bradyrhizobium sp. 197]
MPLMKYFGFVGSSLVLLLIGLGWCLPQQVAEPTGGSTDRPAIRIASAERLPERVIIDTSLPTIVSPPSVLEFAERWPQAAVAAVVPPPRTTTPAPVGDVAIRPNLANRERSKKVAVHHAASKTNIEPSRNDKAMTPPAVAELSLLDSLKEGLGQAQEKLMASLEPLAANASKSRLEKRR